MFNCNVLVSGAVESSALGSVKIGMNAMGIENKWTPKITQTYQPDSIKHSTYLKQFEKFERIYEIAKKEMSTTAANTVTAGLVV